MESIWNRLQKSVIYLVHLQSICVLSYTLNSFSCHMLNNILFNILNVFYDLQHTIYNSVDCAWSTWITLLIHVCLPYSDFFFFFLRHQSILSLKILFSFSTWVVSCNKRVVSCSNQAVSCSKWVVSCSKREVSCSKQVVCCTKQGVSCSNREVSCSKRGVSCTKRVVSCSNQVVSCSKWVVRCSKRVVRCSKRGVSCTKEGVSCSNRGVCCTKRVVSCAKQVVSSAKLLWGNKHLFAQRAPERCTLRHCVCVCRLSWAKKNQLNLQKLPPPPKKKLPLLHWSRTIFHPYNLRTLPNHPPSHSLTSKDSFCPRKSR